MCFEIETYDVSGNQTDPQSAEAGRRVIRLGQNTDFMTCRAGELVWRTMRYGIIVDHDPTGGLRPHLISTAFDEKLETTEHWTGLIRQRTALPVSGYRWTKTDAPVMTPPLFAVGFFDAQDPDSSALISEPSADGRRLMLVGGEDADAWLLAKQWDALQVIRTAARQRHAA